MKSAATTALFTLSASLLVVQSQASDTNYGKATHVIKLRSAMNSSLGKSNISKN